MLDTVHNQGLRLALGAFRVHLQYRVLTWKQMSHRYGYAEKNCLFSMPSDLLLTLLTLLLKSHFHHNFRNITEENLTLLNPSAFIIAPLLESSNINIKNIQKHSFSDIPSWCITKPNILFDLHNSKKSLSDSHLMKQNFQELQS